MSDPSSSSTRKVIVAVHGAGMHAGVWGGLVPHLLAYHFRAVVLPGHGGSGAPLADIPAMAAWLRRERLDDMQPGSVILMGHSMGALVALAAAAGGHPAVTSLVLMGAALSMPVNTGLLTAAADDLPAAQKMIAKWGVFSGHPQAEAARSVTLAAMQDVHPQALAMDLAACNDYDGGLAAAAAISCPVLVVAGQEDKMTPPDGAAALADALPDAQSVLVDGGGHMLMLEKPVETAQEIKAFLSVRGIG